MVNLRRSSPLSGDEKYASISKEEQGEEESTKRGKLFEFHTTAIYIGSRDEAGVNKTPWEGLICTQSKVYRTPLTSTYKKKYLSEDSNYGME